MKNTKAPKSATRNGNSVALTPSRKSQDPLDGVMGLMERAKVKCQQLYDDDLSIEEHCKKINFPLRALPREAGKLAAMQKANATTVKVELEVPIWMYGAFCEAAPVLGLTDWKAALEHYLDSTIADWQNDGFFLDYGID
jgi:hypothetical protein